jgi:mannose-1-phosphate guanylyltransferase
VLKIFILFQVRSQSVVLEEQTPTVPRRNLIYEPVGKNTLPCIGLAALFAAKDDPEGVMVVSPSDHLIQDDELFRDTVLAAAHIAREKDGLVTIGITPVTLPPAMDTFRWKTSCRTKTTSGSSR